MMTADNDTARPVGRGSARAAQADAAETARVGVRELRQNLSVYLDRVKLGESLAVTERGQVVAVLRPVSVAETIVERLVADGRVARPDAPLAARRAPCRLADVPATASILDEVRQDRL
jgi:prevent-host-death family protein